MTTHALSPSPVADRVRELVVSGVGVCVEPAGAAPDWFDYRTELGAQGYKYVPRAAQYLLSAAKRALADAGLAPDGQDDRCGVVLGSNNCASQLHADIDREVANTGIRFLRPATVPYFSVNLFLARLGIEYGWRGLTMALHSPATAGVETVQYGYRAVRDHDVDWLVLGATETPPDPTHASLPAPDDGAAVLIVEPASRAASRGARVYGSLASSSLFVPPSAAARDADAEVDRLRAVLADQGVSDDIPVHLLGDSSPVTDVVSRALPRARRRTVGPGCLSPVLEVADILRSGGPSTAVVCANAVGTVAVTMVVPTRSAPGGNP